MAFEPNYERVASSYRSKLGSTQAIIECKLPANENTNIVKVLCANAKAYISNTEVLEGEINFNGYASFLVIYESEDGVQSLDYSAEFKEKFKNTAIKMGDVASVTASVVDVNTSSTGASSDIKVVAVVEISVDTITTTTANVLTGVDGFFSQTEMLSFASLVSSMNEKFDVSGEVDIRDSVFKVLSVCPSVFLDSAIPNSSFVALKGGVNLNICYLTNSETPEIRSYQTTIDFSQELANTQVNNTSALQSMLNLLSNDITINTKLTDDVAQVNLVIPLQYVGYVFQTNQTDAVTDIFSTEHFVNLNTQSLTSIVNEPSSTYTEKISGSVVLDDAAPFIDEILGNCCNHVVLANSTMSDGTLVVEGIAYTTVMYWNKENASNQSIEVEIPFSLNLMTTNLSADSTPLVSIALGDVLTRSKRGREIEVNATLYVFSDFYNENTEAVISQITIGEEKPESDCVLSIYIAKPNDTLWDIAKELNVSPDMILEQNESLQLPLVGGERILIYRQREILF